MTSTADWGRTAADADQRQAEREAEESSLSLRAACGVLESYGFGENAMIALLGNLRDAGLIKSNGFQGRAVMLSDLHNAMKAL